MQKLSLKALQRERFLSSQHTNTTLAVMSGTRGTVIASYVTLLLSSKAVKIKWKRNTEIGLVLVSGRAVFCLALLFHLNCAWKL